MIRPFLMCVLFSFAVVGMIGCGEQFGDNPGENGKKPKVKLDGSKYLLPSEPEGAKNIIEARKSTKDKDEVVLVGRIGGDVNPWIEGRTAFSIVDLSAVPCNEIPGDGCPKPWDYCCDGDLPNKTALVKVVDDNGRLINHDARELLQVKELSTVVVRGVAQRDKDGNFTVLAKNIYVKKK